MSDKQNGDPQTLMLLAKEGDREAYGALYEQFFTPVFRYIYRRTQDRETAEDLAQTVFLKIFQSVKNFTDQGISPLAYFFATARNAVIDFGKKKKEVTLDDSESGQIEIEADKSENPDVKMKQKDMQKDLEIALRTLPADQREALSLRFLSGLKNAEISVVMKKSEESIRQSQCRALQTLRKNTSLKIHL